ncbi:hypothetical protein ACOMHN_015697 [Nucella lapillus]
MDGFRLISITSCQRADHSTIVIYHEFTEIFCTFFHSLLCGYTVNLADQVGQFIFFYCQSINVISKSEVCDVRPSNADCAHVVFKSVTHDSFEKDVEESWREGSALTDSYRDMEPFPYDTLGEYCAGIGDTSTVTLGLVL